MRFPNFISKCNTIGIIAPSMSANINYLDAAINNFKNMGFLIKEAENIRNAEKLVSAKASIRAEEFMQFFEDEEVDFMISARGGDFLIDIIPILDKNENRIRSVNKIKFMQGFSDISLLNFYITTKFDIATITGANIGDFAAKSFPPSLLDNIKLINGQIKDNTFIQYSYDKYQDDYQEDKRNGFVLNGNTKYISLFDDENITVRGRIIGGCLESIIQLLGTPYDYMKSFLKRYDEGILFYVDIYDSDAPSIYRYLNQIKNAGWFDNVNGILIGRTLGGTEEYDFNYEDALKKSLSDLKIPIVYDVDIGHVFPQFTIINGSVATFSYYNGKGKLIQEINK